MNRVELFELIRKQHLLEGLSINKIAKQHGIHRRTVRQALASAQPPERQVGQQSSVVLTPLIKKIIDEWLEADKKAPKKQRHTGQRLYERLVLEYDFQGKLPTLRKYLGQRKRELRDCKPVCVNNFSQAT